MRATPLTGTGVGPLLLAAVAAGLGFACTGNEEDVEVSIDGLGSRSGYLVRVTGRTLILTGTGVGPSRLALRLQTPDLLAVDVNDDGSADAVFRRSTFDRIQINGGAGDDAIRMDESSGSFTNAHMVTIDGGRGDDTLLGGSVPRPSSAAGGQTSSRAGWGSTPSPWGRATTRSSGIRGTATTSSKGMRAETG